MKAAGGVVIPSSALLVMVLLVRALLDSVVVVSSLAIAGVVHEDAAADQGAALVEDISIRRRNNNRHRDLSCCVRVCLHRRRAAEETFAAAAAAAAANETTTTTSTLRTIRRRRGAVIKDAQKKETETETTAGAREMQQEQQEQNVRANQYVGGSWGGGNRCHYDCSRCNNDDDGDDDDSYDDDSYGDDGYDDDDGYVTDDDDDVDTDDGVDVGEEEDYYHDYPGDLGIRFNKFTWPDGEPQGWEPLQRDDYPLRGQQAEQMRTSALASSIVLADDFQYQHDAKRTAHEYIMSVGGYPPQPSRNPNGSFWKEMLQVVDWQYALKANVNPNTLFRLPDLWKDFTILEVAEAVHDEYPASLQANFAKFLWGDGATLDADMFPFRSKLDFIGFQIRCSYLNSWAAAAVGPITFRLKWIVGRPRPEEIAYLIATDKITAADGAPAELVQKVKAMKLEAATDFGPYPEGSPRHPAWPAMHSSGSTASFWLKIILNLTEEQYCQALLTDYAVSMARTVAGVHYERDNLDGLNLGQQIIAEQLADLMASYYGSDKAAVQAKIDQERFDWRKFDPETCSRG
jgi:hypothetical protein